MSKNLEAWVHRISDQEIPIFKNTVNAVSEVTEDDETSASDLAHVVLQDASLTARILRIANSVVYNPAKVPINTISRAVFFVGFNTIRTISLSLAIIDALLKSGPREYVHGIMAQSLHAAEQARSFAEQRGDESPEEVFIASLLYRLGEMAFWCVAGKEGEELLQVMEEEDCDAETAQLKVLGFTFKQLTVGLTRDWHLGDLLNSAVNKPLLKNPRIQNITLAQEMAKEAMNGWNSNESRVVLAKISQHLNLSDEKTRELVHDNARKAVATAQQYGATSAAKLIPSPDDESQYIEEEQIDLSEFPEPDPMLQLNILRDLSAMLNENPNLSLIMETILEGIYRGIGMDRAVFAMLTPDKSLLRAKNALGNNAEQFARHFSFNIKVNPNIFQHALEKNQSIWVHHENINEYKKILPGSLIETL
ncbi:MAG: HDOD domain-containing protein, partial [Thioalkalispiraceae bacterium]